MIRAPFSYSYLDCKVHTFEFAAIDAWQQPHATYTTARCDRTCYQPLDVA